MSRRLGMILVIIAACTAPALAAPQEPLVTAAIDAVTNNKLREFAKSVEADLMPLVRSETPDLERLYRLTALREFGRYFGRIERKKLTPSQIETLKWLADKPKLLTTLMLALRTEDSPDEVIAVLDALHVDLGDRLEQFPDLTAAMCVVWDSPAPRAGRRQLPRDQEKSLDTTRPRLLMHYYTNARDRLRFDPQHLPFQLAVYVVDNLVSEEEIVWALDRYASRSAIGSVYFDVPYDFGAYYGTVTAQAEARGSAYTLPNLVLVGGICADQAYFATQVARTLGVPAVTAEGTGGTGQASHAWVGYFHDRGRTPRWDFDEGRYAEYQFFKGRCIDPQTREPITEADVALLAELWDRTPQQRFGSIALCKSADLAVESSRAQVYMNAINLSPGNRAAWFALADLSARLRLGDDQTRELFAVVQKFAAHDYPDFALALLLRSIAGRGTTQQLQLLDSFKALFDPNRPDIQADLDIARGDLLRREKHPVEALAAYGQSIIDYGRYGPIAIDLLDRIEPLLRENKELNRLADIYQFVWQKLAIPDISAHAATTPFYIIGQRYEAVLKEIGDDQEAVRVRSRLDSINTAARSQDATRAQPMR